MARPVQPCPSWAAYKRHLRNKEDPCDGCREAARDQRVKQLDGDRDVRKLSVLAPVVDLPAVPDDVFDPLADAKDNLRMVKSALDNAVPREVAALSKRRQELVALIVELGGKKEVSLADQLAEIRARRSSGA